MGAIPAIFGILFHIAILCIQNDHRLSRLIHNGHIRLVFVHKRCGEILVEQRPPLLWLQAPLCGTKFLPVQRPAQNRAAIELKQIVHVQEERDDLPRRKLGFFGGVPFLPPAAFFAALVTGGVGDGKLPDDLLCRVQRLLILPIGTVGFQPHKVLQAAFHQRNVGQRPLAGKNVIHQVVRKPGGEVLAQMQRPAQDDIFPVVGGKAAVGAIDLLRLPAQDVGPQLPVQQNLAPDLAGEVFLHPLHGVQHVLLQQLLCFLDKFNDLQRAQQIGHGGQKGSLLVGASQDLECILRRAVQRQLSDALDPAEKHGVVPALLALPVAGAAGRKLTGREIPDLKQLRLLVVVLALHHCPEHLHGIDPGMGRDIEHPARLRPAGVSQKGHHAHKILHMQRELPCPQAVFVQLQAEIPRRLALDIEVVLIPSDDALCCFLFVDVIGVIQYVLRLCSRERLLLPCNEPFLLGGVAHFAPPPDCRSARSSS